jgi:hypothetical protein
MATDIKLKDYILYKYKERIKEKGAHYIICYRNIKWQLGVLQFHSAYTRAAPGEEPKLPVSAQSETDTFARPRSTP